MAVAIRRAHFDASAALRFVHRDDMEAEGYAAYLNQVDVPMTEEGTLAGEE